MNRRSNVAAPLVFLAALALAGCGATASGPLANEVVSVADELATTGPTYAAGTVLAANADLNLRAGAGTGHPILRVMPAGSRVTVRVTSGANAWVAVRFNGYDGWAHTGYLAQISAPASPAAASPSVARGAYSESRGALLARTALRRDGYASAGLCALEVSNSVERSGIVPRGANWYRNNAVDIAEYMNANPSYTGRVGFSRGDTAPSQIKKGSIIAWRRGQCGYHRTYGHIEISVDDSSSRACSDFCGSIRKTCGNPYVYFPTVL